MGNFLGGQNTVVEADGTVRRLKQLGVLGVADKQIVSPHRLGRCNLGHQNTVYINAAFAPHLVGHRNGTPIDHVQSFGYDRALVSGIACELEFQYVIGIAAEQSEIVVLAVEEGVERAADRTKFVKAQLHSKGVAVDQIHDGLGEIVLHTIDIQTCIVEIALVANRNGQIVIPRQIFPSIRRSTVLDAAVEGNQTVADVEILHVYIAIHGGVALDLGLSEGSVIETDGAIECVKVTMPLGMTKEQVTGTHGRGGRHGRHLLAVDIDDRLTAHLVGDGDEGVLQKIQAVLYRVTGGCGVTGEFELQNVAVNATEQREGIVCGVHDGGIGISGGHQISHMDFNGEGIAIDRVHDGFGKIVLRGAELQTVFGKVVFVVYSNVHIVATNKILPNVGGCIVSLTGVLRSAVKCDQACGHIAHREA